MSSNKSLNKVLKNSAKALDKTRNPIDKLARLSSNTSDIAHRVARDCISQAKKGADNVVDISTRRLRSARDQDKWADLVQAQIDTASADVRLLVDVARDTFDVVTDGLVDTVDEISYIYDAYRKDRKSKVFENTQDKVKDEAEFLTQETAEKPVKKAVTAKKLVARKAAAVKKPAEKKPAARKPAAKKPMARKTAAKKSGAKKSVEKATRTQGTSA